MPADLTDYDVTEAMLCCGGSFVRKLAEAFRCADETNQARLRDAFPHEWMVYTELAALLRAKRGLVERGRL